MPAEELAKKIKVRFDSMKSVRGTWETHWQEVADFVLPRKGTVNRTEFPGSKRNLQKFDSTAVQANELLAGALHGLLTNPATEFFTLSTGDPTLDEIDEVRQWLQFTTTDIHNILNASNFQTQIHEVYVDLGSFGTSALEMMEDDDKVVRFRAHPIGEIYIDENNKERVDAIFRRFKWSARQIIQEFGEEKAGPDILKAMKDNPNDKFDIIHAVFPASDMPELNLSRPIADIYILEQKLTVLSLGGFREMPFAVPRWTKATGEIYGRSPAMKGLPDIKMLNSMLKTVIKAGQKVVDPPLMIPDDGFLSPIRIMPGGINYFRAGTGDRIEPLLTGGRLDIGIQLIEFTAKKVKDAFFLNQLQLQEGPQKTATEVLQLTEENARLLGPILGRQNDELLRPLIDRVFPIMLRKGLIRPVPEAISGKELKVQYNSLIARAQQTQEAQNLVRAFDAIAPFLQIDPAMADNINGDEVVPFLLKKFGVPQSIIRKKDDVDDMREQRAAQQQQQQQAEQQQQDAQTAQLGAQAISTLQAG